MYARAIIKINRIKLSVRLRRKRREERRGEAERTKDQGIPKRRQAKEREGQTRMIRPRT